MRIAFRIFAGLLLLGLLGLATLALLRRPAVEALRTRTALRSPQALQELVPLEVNGTRQWLFLRAEDPAAPVLLFVHGGPGSPMLPRARYFDDILTDHFVVAHWTQRGAGKSFDPGIPGETMTLDRFVADAAKVVDYLKGRFGEEAVFVVGSSWGTVLGAQLAKRHPEDVRALVLVGTDVHALRGEELSYAFVKRRAREEGDEEALDRLREIGPPPYERLIDVARQRALLRRFGGTYHGGDSPVFGRRYGWASPEYGLLDVARMVAGEIFSAWHMYMGLVETVDLFAQVPRLEVPVYFFQGRHDWQTPSPLVEAYAEQLEAPHKELVWFERSGHAPYEEQPQAFQRRLVGRLEPGAVHATQERALDRVVQILRERRDLPGLQVALRTPDGRVWSGRAGFARREPRRAVSAETLFEVGSVSKAFTAALVLREVQAGRLALDGNANAHLPPAWRVRDPEGRAVPVRIADLLAHRTGLSPLASGYGLPRTLGLFLGLLPEPRWHPYLDAGFVLRRPGARLRYSNDGYILLGGLLEEVRGTPFPALARRELLRPLGLRRAGFDPRAVRARGDVAVPYDGDGELATRHPGAWPSGSLHASARGLLRFAGVFLDGRDPILGSEMREAMTSLQARAAPGLEFGYGFGLRVTRLFGHRALCHEGTNPGAASRLCFLPEVGVAAAASTNRGDLRAVVDAVNRLLAEALRPEPRPTATVPEATARALTGSWHAVGTLPDVLGFAEPWLARFSIARREGELVAELPGLGSAVLRPTSEPRTFRIRGAGGERLVVRRGEDGALHAYAGIWHLRRG